MSHDERSVWTVYHSQMNADQDDTESDEIEMTRKVIGYYSSEAQAEAAVARMRQLPGFRLWPDGFRIYEGALDHELWNSGFANWDDDGLS